MPSNELKQRKKTTQKQHDEASDVAKTNGETETKKLDEQKSCPRAKSSSCFPEVRTILCLLCVSACVALTWLVIQQNERLAEVEKNYRLLHSRTATYSELEQRVERVSEKLDASRSRLQGALSSIPTATRLLSEVASLRSVVTAIQASEGDGDSSDVTSSSIQEVNARFLNVTEAWQSGLAAVTSDLTALREESRASHVRATDGVNESERRLRALTERLEELQDSTRRNARVFERTEEDDVQQARRQLDWTSERVAHMDGAVTQLQRRDRELAERLEEQEARQQECQEHLPAVEEAVRSILRLTTGLQALERRAEELGGEVMGLEDSMLRGLTQTLDIKQRVDTLVRRGGAGVGQGTVTGDEGGQVGHTLVRRGAAARGGHGGLGTVTGDEGGQGGQDTFMGDTEVHVGQGGTLMGDIGEEMGHHTLMGDVGGHMEHVDSFTDDDGGYMARDTLLGDTEGQMGHGMLMGHGGQAGEEGRGGHGRRHEQGFGKQIDAMLETLREMGSEGVAAASVERMMEGGGEEAEREVKRMEAVEEKSEMLLETIRNMERESERMLDALLKMEMKRDSRKEMEEEEEEVKRDSGEEEEEEEVKRDSGKENEEEEEMDEFIATEEEEESSPGQQQELPASSVVDV